MRRLIPIVLLALLLLVGTLGATGAHTVYIPLVVRPGTSSPTPTARVAPSPTPTARAVPTPTPTPEASPALQRHRVNAPYFATAELDDHFAEMAIFWFGRVDRTNNYADVRVGYNDSELYVDVTVFDRRLWYDRNPTRETLSDWDALTLFLDTGDARHRFVAQFSHEDLPREAYQAAYRAQGSTWRVANTAFQSRPGWRGEGLNDDLDDRGWAMTFRLPFASLGLNQRPPDGTRWLLALRLDDRDDRAGMPIEPQFWPPAWQLDDEATWGLLNFGLRPSYTPPSTRNPQSFTLRQGLNGLTVPDVAVGGGAVCGDGLDFWSEWGHLPHHAAAKDFNIQNQSDIADWPCFSKYYVTFPLDSLPSGRVVLDAKLILHHFGNAQPADAEPSLIQVFTIDDAWQEHTMTWNNAPLARENVGAAWVPVLPDFPGWPGVPREFDLSSAVAEAYAAAQPLRLALYSADSAYHSGKYFVSSDTDDWNEVARPTLLVTLGSP